MKTNIEGVSMQKQERVEFISAILTASHIMNTQKSEENFSEIVQLYFKYYEVMMQKLPDAK